MLDERTAAVMNYINKVCDGGGYKVIDAQDVIKEMSDKTRIDRDSLRQIVTFLKEREFISVKYAEDDEYCLTSLPKGRAFLESKEEQKKEIRKQTRRGSFMPFFASFLGAFLGCALFYLIYLIGIKG